MEDTNYSFFSKFQIEKEMRARRKKLNEGEEEEQARMEIAGCTGKKQARKQGEEESYHGRTSFFFYYVTFIF